MAPCARCALLAGLSPGRAVKGSRWLCFVCEGALFLPEVDESCGAPPFLSCLRSSCARMWLTCRSRLLRVVLLERPLVRRSSSKRRCEPARRNARQLARRPTRRHGLYAIAVDASKALSPPLHHRLRVDWSSRSAPKTTIEPCVLVGEGGLWVGDASRRASVSSNKEDRGPRVESFARRHFEAFPHRSRSSSSTKGLGSSSVSNLPTTSKE